MRARSARGSSGGRKPTDGSERSQRRRKALGPTVRSLKRFVPRRYYVRFKDVYLTVTSLSYIGTCVECPCCGWEFKSFLPFNGRQNAYCPRCQALERHRLLWLYLKERTNIMTDRLRVLHVAPEHTLQRNLRRLRNLDYLSADMESPTAMIRMDITNIEFEKETFDVVLCCHVLEHVLDDRRAIRELYRVLRPGGWAILQVPIDEKRPVTYEDSSVVTPQDRRVVFGQTDHVRICGRDYVDRFRASGFMVTEARYAFELKKGALKRYGLVVEPILRCDKLA